MSPFSDHSVALLLFVVSYAFIVTERIHKTIVALCGAALMIVSGVMTQEEAFYSREFGVDYNVVFLLIGMMIIVNIVRATGLFEVLAIWSAQRAGAQPFRLLAFLAVVTAVLSAMLDNVTTVLLMALVTLSLANRLQVNPVPFLIVEAIASNIGGTATLVGDPPNIMIASKAELGYLQFLIVLGPVVVIIMGVFLACLRLFYGRGMQVAPHLKEPLLGLQAKDAIRDPRLLRRCVWLLGIVNVAFGLHSMLHAAILDEPVVRCRAVGAIKFREQHVVRGNRMALDIVRHGAPVLFHRSVATLIFDSSASWTTICQV